MSSFDPSSQSNPFNNPPPQYPFPPQPSTYRPAPQQTLSKTALFSLLSAIVSPAGFCFCIPTILGSLLSVILGHLALSRISQSGGQLSGKTLAYIGLVLGYVFLGGSVLMAPLAYTAWTASPATRSPAENALRAAESAISGDSNGVAHGNTPQAKALAAEFANAMKEVRELGFSKSKSKVSLSGGNFVTYCVIRDGKCAFVTHAPDLRNFEEEAKKQLSDLAWTFAQALAARELGEKTELGVGVRGVLLYSEVLTGTATENSAPATRSKDNDDLLPFFGDTTVPAATSK